MEQIKGMLKAMIPVALGVAAGMFIYEQVKKATAKNAA
jgi:predicted small secreted protein